MKMTQRQLRSIIAEEVSASHRRSDLDEGFLDDVVGKVKGFFGKQAPSQKTTGGSTARRPAYVEKYVALLDRFQGQAVDLMKEYGKAGRDLMKIGRLTGRLNAIQQTAMDLASVAANVAGKPANQMYFSVAKHLMSKSNEKPSNEDIVRLTDEIKHKADVFSRNIGNFIKDVSNINLIVRLGEQAEPKHLELLDRLLKRAFSFIESKEQSLWIDDYVKYLQQMPEDLMKENKQTISITRLRQIIKEEYVNYIMEAGAEGTVTTGTDIKGATAAASNASQKIADSSTIKPLLDKIKTANDLAAFLQQITDDTAKTGLVQDEVVAGVKKFATAVVNAKPAAK